MTPTSFEFTVTMARDERLAGAVRQLAMHAAGYAKLPREAGEGLAGHVERATEAAMAAAPDRRPIQVTFAGAPDCLEVVISCECGVSPEMPPSVTSGAISVDWTREGSRHTCRIRQRIA